MTCMLHRPERYHLQHRGSYGWDRRLWAREMAAYVRDEYGAFHEPKFKCGCCEMLVFRACGGRQNFLLFSLYYTPDLDDWIYECLLTSMAAVQAEDMRASFLVMDDLNGHYQEWLGSTTMNHHGVAALDFTTESSCDQLLTGPIHAHGELFTY